MEPIKNHKTTASSRNIYVVGTQTGKCQLCKQTRPLLLLKYGFSLCEDCLNICTKILEELDTTTQKPTHKSGRKNSPTKIRNH